MAAEGRDTGKVLKEKRHPALGLAQRGTPGSSTSLAEDAKEGPGNSSSGASTGGSGDESMSDGLDGRVCLVCGIGSDDGSEDSDEDGNDGALNVYPRVISSSNKYWTLGNAALSFLCQPRRPSETDEGPGSVDMTTLLLCDGCNAAIHLSCSGGSATHLDVFRIAYSRFIPSPRLLIAVL